MKSRYALVAASLGFSVLTGALITEQKVNIAREASSINLETRFQLIQRSRHIRDAVWQAREALEIFLLDPNVGERIHTSINNSLNHTDRLLEHSWVKDNDHYSIVERLRQALLRLDDSSRRLIATRKDPSRQYPSIAIARDDMYEVHANFNEELDVLLQEMLVWIKDPATLNRYQQYMTLSRYWQQLISVFRMYLINRISSFSQETLLQQEQNVELYFQQIMSMLDRFIQDNRGAQADPFVVQALQNMRRSAIEWNQLYLKVKQIHLSYNWRTDLQIFKTEIETEFEESWSSLQAIDLLIESHFNRDIQYLNQITEDQNRVFWFFAGLSLLAIVIGFLLLERFILRPLSDISVALRDEAQSNEAHPLPQYDIQEVRTLIEAFHEMRDQVHNRRAQLEYQTLHDPLTGLANRNLLNDRLHQAIQTAKRRGNSLSLFILDLDRFKEVNDTLGHQVGDLLLQQVGQRINQSLRQIDTVARLGGDEFAVLLAEDDEATARTVAKKILKAMEKPFSVNNIHLYVGASIGIAVFPLHGLDASTLVKSADVAMYTAKRNRYGYSFYDYQHDPHSISRLSLGADLRDALENEELDLVYQPIMDVQTKQVRKAEVLLRWHHPQNGAIPPHEIITLAERIGLINNLTYWVTEQAIKQCQQWRSRGIDIVPSVNLSAYCLQDNQLLQKLGSLMATYQLAPGQLTLEITENAMIADPEKAVQLMTQLGEMGIHLAIDDYGTGFSSLAYIKRLPVNELKIDKSFIMHMSSNDNDAVIVRSTIELAHNLGLEVVAEGVEDQETLDLLQLIRCNSVQGFFLHKPVDARTLEDWFIRSNPGYNIVKLNLPS